MSGVSPRKAMVIMAHPDEVEYFVGGTVAQWTDDSTEVVLLILTNGNKGSQDPDMSPERLVAIRQAEQRAAAKVLRAQQIVFFDEPDGELEPTVELRKRITAEVRRYRPEVVILPDPTGYFHHPTDSHHDLRPAGEVALAAVHVAAGSRMYHPELLAEGLEPHAVGEIWLASPSEPNHWVDITPQMARKVRALCCHSTQVPDPQVLDRQLRARNLAASSDGHSVYHEAFRVVDLA